MTVPLKFFLVFSILISGGTVCRIMESFSVVLYTICAQMYVAKQVSSSVMDNSNVCYLFLHAFHRK